MILIVRQYDSMESVKMGQIDSIDSEKYILLSEVAEKCPSLTEKWSRLTEKWSSYSKKSQTLENRLIIRACQGKLNLYCFKVVPPGVDKQWFSIGRVGIEGLMHELSTVSCVPFIDNPKDQVKADFDSIIQSKSETVKVRKSDLYLDLAELDNLEKTDKDFYNQENSNQNFGNNEVNIEINSSREKPNCIIESDIKKDTSKIGCTIIKGRRRSFSMLSKNNSKSSPLFFPELETDTIFDKQLPIPKRIDKESEVIAQFEKPKVEETPNRDLASILPCSCAEKLPSENNSGSKPAPSAEFETTATLDSRPLLSRGIDEESDLTAPVKKPSKNNLPPKKKGKIDIHNVDEVIEPIPLCKDEKERPALKKQAVLEESYLRLWDIIGDKKKGIQGIIPMSRTKWYDGINAGIFPKQFKLGQRSVAWKKSDILALLERMEKGELIVGPID